MTGACILLHNQCVADRDPAPEVDGSAVSELEGRLDQHTMAQAGATHTEDLMNVNLETLEAHDDDDADIRRTMMPARQRQDHVAQEAWRTYCFQRERRVRDITAALEYEATERSHTIQLQAREHARRRRSAGSERSALRRRTDNRR